MMNLSLQLVDEGEWLLDMDGGKVQLTMDMASMIEFRDLLDRAIENDDVG